MPRGARDGGRAHYGNAVASRAGARPPAKFPADRRPLRYHVHFVSSESARSRAGTLAQPLFALRDELAATLSTLEERKRWKPLAAPGALIAHASQMVRLLEEVLADGGTVSRQAPETQELRRRLTLVQAMFAGPLAADGDHRRARSRAAPVAPEQTA